MKNSLSLSVLMFYLLFSRALMAMPIVQSYWLMDGSASFEAGYTEIMSQMSDYEDQMNNDLMGVDFFNGVERTSSIDGFNRMQRFVDPSVSAPTPSPWGPPFDTVGPAYELSDIQLQSPDILIISLAGDDAQSMSVSDYENYLLPALDIFAQSATLFINIVRYPDGDPETLGVDSRYNDLLNRYGGINVDLSQFDMQAYTSAVVQQVRSAVVVSEPVSLILFVFGLLSYRFCRKDG